MFAPLDGWLALSLEVVGTVDQVRLLHGDYIAVALTGQSSPLGHPTAAIRSVVRPDLSVVARSAHSGIVALDSSLASPQLLPAQLVRYQLTAAIRLAPPLIVASQQLHVAVDDQ